MTVNEITDRIRKEVDSLTKPGETWTVKAAPKISVTLSKPNDSTSPQRAEIDASNCDGVGSVMESLRSDFEALARKYEEYEKALLEKCKPEA